MNNCSIQSLTVLQSASGSTFERQLLTPLLSTNTENTSLTPRLTGATSTPATPMSSAAIPLHSTTREVLPSPSKVRFSDEVTYYDRDLAGEKFIMSDEEIAESFYSHREYEMIRGSFWEQVNRIHQYDKNTYPKVGPFSRLIVQALAECQKFADARAICDVSREEMDVSSIQQSRVVRKLVTLLNEKPYIRGTEKSSSPFLGQMVSDTRVKLKNELLDAQRLSRTCGASPEKQHAELREVSEKISELSAYWAQLVAAIDQEINADAVGTDSKDIYTDQRESSLLIAHPTSENWLQSLWNCLKFWG